MNLTDEEFEKYSIVEWDHTLLGPNSVSGQGSRQVKPVSNTVIFYNQGTVPATIDGVLRLVPGQGFTYECYPDEVSVHTYTITWDNISGTQAVVMICKEYTAKRF